jgi:thiol-disulfide isomerase/thioredoxin
MVAYIMKKKFFPIIILILAFSGFISTQIVWDIFQLNAEQSTEENNRYGVYESNLKSIPLKTIEGKSIDIPSLTSPIIILNFWASWCLPCLKEFPSLMQLKKKFEGQVSIIGINGDEDKPEEQIKKMSEKYQLEFFHVTDKDSSIGDKFLVTAYPFTVIYFKGKVIHFSQKTMDFMNTDLVKKIEELLKAPK